MYLMTQTVYIRFVYVYVLPCEHTTCITVTGDSYQQIWALCVVVVLQLPICFSLFKTSLVCSMVAFMCVSTLIR